MAPVMPFFAESLYLAMRSESDTESVHLCEWPEAGKIDESLIQEMRQVRTLASKGLELREKAGIKLRQPLLSFTTGVNLRHELKAILADELNVKEVIVSEDVNILEDSLNTELTVELKEEGMVRNLVRRVQEWRKEQGLSISDRPVCELEVNSEEKEVAQKHRATIIEETNLEDLKFTDA